MNNKSRYLFKFDFLALSMQIIYVNWARTAKLIKMQDTRLDMDDNNIYLTTQFYVFFAHKRTGN